MKVKSVRLLAPIALGLGLVLALLWLLDNGLSTSAAAVAELHVCPSGCTYSSIQAAVDDATDDDVIEVAAGDYTDLHQRVGITQVVYISKTVTIQGGYTTTNWTTPDPAANLTSLDAQGGGRVLVIRGAGPTIAGFTITGGSGDYSGGGINVENASPVIRDNQIKWNSAKGDGGGIFVNRGAAQILHNRIFSNTATWAGGLRIINDADVTIIANQIISNVAQISGGGIELDCCGSTTPLIAQNFIVNNNGGLQGGGVWVMSTQAKLVNNIIADNQANYGASIYLDGSAYYPVSATILHNTLVGGPAGGEAVWVSDYVTATLVNNIVVSHTVGITNTAPISSTVSGDHTLFNANGTDYGSGVSSANEVHGNPAFVNPGEGDYHIGPGSAAIDVGMSAKVYNDIDGDIRPQGSGYDIGADEFGYPWHIYLPLAVKNWP